MIDRILVLEDDHEAREAITEYLGLFGWELISAGNPRNALHMAERSRPDLAICDWELGESETGIDVARQLQSRFGTQIILVSGRSTRALERASSDIDVVCYLSKPYSLDTLRQAIRDANP